MQNVNFLFYKQLFKLYGIFGAKIQKRESWLSNHVQGFYKEFAIFDWDYLFFSYRTFFSFLSLFFLNIKKRMILNPVLNKKHVFNIKLMQTLRLQNIFYKYFLFIDLRAETQFLLYDTNRLFHCNVLYFWYPGLFSNYFGLSPSVKTNFLGLFNETPHDLVKKFVIIFDPINIKNLLKEFKNCAPTRSLKLLIFTNTLDHSFYYNNCLFRLPGNTESFQCLYYYFYFLLTTLTMFSRTVNAFGIWLEYLLCRLEKKENLLAIKRHSKNTLFALLYNFQQYGFIYRWGKRRRARRWLSKFLQRLGRRLTRQTPRLSVVFDWLKFHKTYRLLFKKIQGLQRLSFSVDNPFEFRVQPTPVEFMYRKIRKNIVNIFMRRQPIFWHYRLKQISFRAWFHSYKVGEFVLTKQNSIINYTPFPAIMTKSVHNKIMLSCNWRFRKLRRYWVPKLRNLWTYFRYIRNFPAMDVYLILAIYLLNHTSWSSTISNYLFSESIPFNDLKNFNKLDVSKCLQILVTGANHIHYPKAIREYLVAKTKGRVRAPIPLILSFMNYTFPRRTKQAWKSQRQVISTQRINSVAGRVSHKNDKQANKIGPKNKGGKEKKIRL